MASTAGLSSLVCNPATFGPNSLRHLYRHPDQGSTRGRRETSTLTNTNSTLTIPTSVTVAASANSATFSAATTAIASDQSATLTATYNSSAANTTVNLSAPTLISSLACNPTSLGSNASSACTVTLTKAAPTGGASVALSSTNAALTVPASVAVPATATSATFSASTASLSTSQTATVTATLVSSSSGVTISLVAAVTPSSTSCSPSNLVGGASSTCTVTLNKPSVGWSVLTLSSNNANLTIPAGLVVVNGATTATFPATAAAAIPATQPATVSVGLNGAVATAGVNLMAAMGVSSLSCNPASIGPSASTTCTVTLSNTAPAGGSVVTLSNSNPNLTAPPTVTVTAGAATSTFTASTGTISSDQGATLTATYGASSASATLQLVAPVVISSLACNPTSLGPNSSGTCTVTLTKAAPAGGVNVTLTNTNTALSVPPSVTVAAAATSTTFTATTAAINSDQSATLTAAYNGSSANTTVSLAASVRISSLACNPASLGPNSSSTCTVTLTKAAPTGGAGVTLANTNSALTVPTSITVAATATSASLQRHNGSHQQRSELRPHRHLQRQFRQRDDQPRGERRRLLTGLQPRHPWLELLHHLHRDPDKGCANRRRRRHPGQHQFRPHRRLTSITVAAAATSATFNATTAAISSDQNATITATYNSSSANATVNLVASTVVSSLACNPTSLAPNSSGTCTITLTKSAPAGGANVLVSTVNSALTAPSTVTVTAGSNSATFSLQAGSFTTNQSGSVTASYNSSSQSVVIPLNAPVLVTSLACNPSGAMSGAISSCTATVSQPAPNGTTLALTSTSPLITVPASIPVQPGTTSATFSATIGSIAADAAGSVTATIGASSQSANFTLWSTPALSSLSCATTKVTGGGGTTCTATMSKPAGNVSVDLSSNNPALFVPASVTVPQGSVAAAFNVTTLPTASGWIIVTAAYNGVSKPVLFTLTAAQGSVSAANLSQLSCTPKTLSAGSRGTCRVTLNHVQDATTANVQLSSSSASVRLPERVQTRRGQSIVEFHVDAISSEKNVVVAAILGSDQVQETLTVAPDRPNPIHVPGRQFVKYGTEIRFRISPSDSAAAVSAGALPAGAYFDSATGEFWWTPDRTQLGAHEIAFASVDSTGATANASVTVQVDSGEPVVTGIVNAASRSREAACSPGAIAAIQGRWLITGAAVADASGSSTELAATRVWANGTAIPILSASDTELNVLCPNSVPGTELHAFVVQTDHGVAEPARTTTRSVAPGLFSVDGSGSGQGYVLLEGARTLAVVRNYRLPGQPAVPGEHLLVYATGIDRLTNISIQIGEAQIKPIAVNPVPEQPGLLQIVISIPDGVMGESSLSLTGDTPESLTVRTNVLNIAVEPNTR